MQGDILGWQLNIPNKYGSAVEIHRLHVLIYSTCHHKQWPAIFTKNQHHEKTMAISRNDERLLWGRAAGHCSNPTCGKELTALLANGEGYNIGEMAHIIARQEDGPRGQKGGGADGYANLVLLCPSCHRMIDKAPDGEFPEEMLHEWKQQQEAKVAQVGNQVYYTSFDDLKQVVSDILLENRLIWEELGPQSATAQGNPTSNLHQFWTLQKLSTIVPNNRRIINIIQNNMDLLSKEKALFLRFKMHAEAFEQNQYDRLDKYPLFPQEFSEVFSSE